MTLSDRFLEPRYSASIRVDCQGWKDCPECQGTAIRHDLPDYVLDLMVDTDPALACVPCRGRGLVPCEAQADTGYECLECGFVNEEPYEQEEDYLDD
jgi:hypothetical protein